MARRRGAVSDDVVMAAVAEALRHEGPGATLAAIAQRAGLSAPRLVQRHGTRDQLILAAVEWSSAQYLASVRRCAESPVPFAACLDLIEAGSRGISARDFPAIGQWAAFHWASPALRAFNRRYVAQVRRALAAVLQAAVRAGELRPHDSSALAEQLLVHWFGMAIYYPLAGDLRTYRRELRRVAERMAAPYRPPEASVPNHEATASLGTR